MDPVTTADRAKGENSGAGPGRPPDRGRRGTPAADGTPATADAMMPLWAVSLGWELGRGRQVILNGQIRDRWWLADRPASFREVISRPAADARGGGRRMVGPGGRAHLSAAG